MRGVNGVESASSGQPSFIDALFMQLFLADSVMQSWLQVHRPDRMRHKPFLTLPRSYELGSPIYHAASLSFEETVRVLLDDSDMAINARGGNYGYPLGAAAAHGHTNVCLLLIQRGARLENEDKDKDFSGKGTGTALGLAARFGHKGTVKLLLQNGANIDGGSGVHYSPSICAAASNEHEQVVDLLIKSGVNVSARSFKGWTALHGAARNEHLSIIKTLLDNEADIEAPGERNQIPLFSAAEYDKAEAVALLLERGADTEVKDCWDWTALTHSVVHNDKTAALAILLDKGANPRQ